MLAQDDPLYAHTILGLAYAYRQFSLGENAFSAALFGSRGGLNWSVSQLADPRRGGEYSARLGSVLRALGVGKAMLCDSTQFNAVVLDASAFARPRQLGGHVLWTAGEPAEGTTLGRYDAGVQSPAGCYTLVAARPGFEPVKAHMGRWSLINRLTHLAGARREALDNVCVSALARLGVSCRRDAAEVRAKVLWGIPPHRFPHPRAGRHAAANRWLLSHIRARWGEDCVIEGEEAFYPRLALIAQTELGRHGVRPEHVDLSESELPRGEAYVDGRQGEPRNLVVIKRVS